MWAPEIHFVDNRYIIYFTARDISTDKLCIGAAYSYSHLGPYKDIGQPLVEDEDQVNGVLDPHHFSDSDGTPYLLWKTDDNYIGKNSSIYIRQINQDGLSFDEGKGISKLLSATLEWEICIAEGPWMIYRNGFYYLFYSGNWCFGIGYGVGVARSKDLLGPYEKFGERILHTDFETYDKGENTTFVGPGHCSVVEVRYL